MNQLTAKNAAIALLQNWAQQILYLGPRLARSLKYFMEATLGVSMRDHMKILCLGLCLFLTAGYPNLASAGPNTSSGPSNGGGGEILRSTQTQVTDYLYNTRDNGLTVKFNALWYEIRRSISARAAMPVHSERARAILKSIDDAFIAEMRKRNINPSIFNALLPLAGNMSIQNDPCVSSQENTHDASASGSFGSGRICISVNRLRRLTPDAMAQETPALMIHELSHLVGYGEDDAVFIQQYVIDKFVRGGVCVFAMLAEDRTNPRPTGGRNYWMLEVKDRDNGLYNGGSYSPPIAEVGHQANQSSGVGLVTRVSLVENDFYGSWSPTLGGYVHFATGNTDGTRVSHRIQFGPISCDMSGGICQAPIQTDHLLLDGRPFSVSRSAVNFSRKCLL